MAHLLHLSDLHLRSDPALDIIGDPKDIVIAAPLQQTSARRIFSTLEALGRDIAAGGRDLDLDCIVVSGDIADKNDPLAYSLLPKVLAPLVPTLVPADRVVVVPGNHDVKKGSEPSSAERWQHFLTLRSHRYLTPLLEGIDVDDHGKLIGSPMSPVLAAKDGSFLIVAINSSNHCQTQLPVESDLASSVDTLAKLRTKHPAVEQLWNAWHRRGSVDLSWVGDGQQKAAAAALAAASGSVASDALRIAAIHHQLFPTGAIAELKSFETMVNLGEFLDWIADNGIDVALHGHKHAGRVFPYEHTAFHNSDAAIGYRTLVVSAPTAQSGYDATAPIARLITIDRPQPRTGGVLVRDIPSLESGGRLDVLQRPSRQFRLDAATARGQIVGDDADEVHQKLLALHGDFSGLDLPLVCRIQRGETASTIPSAYPDIPEGITSPQEWFTRTVAWWQGRRAGRAAQFNHGQRLQDFGSARLPSDQEGLDQVRRAAEALVRKESSSRAIAVLVDPDADLAPDESEFPAFVLVQFAIVSGRLDVTGYFRKQEMPHWWPVNAAELSHLQGEVIGRLAGKRPLQPGSVTTITTQPVSGDAVPRVAIPVLNTRVDSQTGMLELVLPLFSDTGVPADETRDAWRQAFEDWAPSGSAAADGDPMPIRGLQILIETLRGVASLHRMSVADELIGEVRLIAATCKEYADTADSQRTEARAQWIADVTQHRIRILELVALRLDGRS
jgi:3',5'-cyclic AMP phosphodiesterase CpdA